MKTKGSIQSFAIFLLLGLVVLLVAASTIGNVTKKSKDLTEEHIIQKLDAQKNNEKSLADKIDGFPPVYASELISEESINFGKAFTQFMFEPDEKYDSTKGYLLSYTVPPLLENKNWEILLKPYSEGLAILYTNGVKYLNLASPSGDLYYLSYSNVCVIPSDDKGLDLAKIMSYATGIKHKDLDHIPTAEEIDTIIKNNEVSQVAFSIGGSDSVMKFFKDNAYYSADYKFDDGKMLAFYKEGTVCFFPKYSTGWKFWRSRFWTSPHVQIDSKDGQDVLTGDGYLNKEFDKNSLNKITDTKKIKKGDYK